MTYTHTVGSLIEAVHDRFSHADLSYGHGTDNAWDEAVSLVLHLTGAADDRAELETGVPGAIVTDVFDVAQRRMEHRIPLPYLLGKAAYMGHEFRVRQGVIVPRSPIGYLLGERIHAWVPARVASVLDLCSGSGCLGILAAGIYTDARVTLVDNDALACDVARENIVLHDVGQRVAVHQADATQWREGAYDLILCNPPYVDAQDMGVLPPEYRAEPAAGLAAGADGLAIMRAVLDALPDLLAPGGLFVGEVGASSPALLREYPTHEFIWPDLELGGEGVFLLEGDKLNSHTARL